MPTPLHSAAVAAKSNVIPMHEADGPDDLGMCGLLRGVKEQSTMLELRLRDGRATAFSYLDMSRADFDPSEGITLTFGQCIVKIIGRMLHVEIRPNVRLFDALVRHRIAWLREDDRAAIFESSNGAVLIERIELTG